MMTGPEFPEANDPQSETPLDAQQGHAGANDPQESASMVDIGDAFNETPADEATSSPASSSGPRLIVKRNGAETEEVFPLHSPATIGRFDPSVGPIDVDLSDLPEGSYVSRKHAKLTAEGDTWSITDLGSSNGTFVLRDGDFQRVDSTELQSGDEIALGNARFVFYS